jgi:glutaredoxin
MTAVVTLYGRPGCCLCDEARELLLEVEAQHPFELVECNIEQDPELHRRYLERIPVVAVDGVEEFEFFVDRARLERLLGASRSTASSAPPRTSRPSPRRPHTHL